MPLNEDEIKARVRQNAMFLTKPEDQQETPLTHTIGKVLKQAIGEHGGDQVKQWMEELTKELGPVRLARVMALMAAAGGPSTL